MWPASIFLVLCGIFILYHGYQYSKELAETVRRMEKMGGTKSAKGNGNGHDHLIGSKRRRNSRYCGGI